jgi:hypothetical protein
MRKTIPLLALTAAAVGTVLAVSAAAHADADAAAVPADLVEDFNYPGAAQVLTDRGIKLLRGDGHLTLADCGADPDHAANNLIVVQSFDDDFPNGPSFCFQAVGTTGVLTMEIPNVYLVRSDASRVVAAKVSVADEPTVVETEQVDPLEWQGVGIGQERGEAVLLELRYPI